MRRIGFWHITQILAEASDGRMGPAPHPDFVKMVVGYALTCKMRLPAVADTITETRYQARTHGRSQILATDIRTALLDYQIPSDEAIQQAFEPLREPGRHVVLGQEKLPVALNLQRRCSHLASQLQSLPP